MMFLSSDAIQSGSPKLEPVTLTVRKEDALRLTQELFLEGRQINALYICTQEELRTAGKRKSSWIASAHDLFERIVTGPEAIDFFDEISLNVLKDSDPIERLSEQFHNELNQRLERLRMVRRLIENSTNPVKAETAARCASSASASTATQEPPSPDAAPPSGLDFLALAEETPVKTAQMKSAVPQTPTSRPALANKTKVMLVLCSRNGTAKQALCRFANQMNLQLEIVDYNPEQPSNIAEQIYHNRDAKFAIVYWGEPTGKELPGSAPPDRYVGFALGFVLGRLGRGRVFILGSTTTPPLPGFTRLLVAQLDSGGGWQIQLARRMKSAGVEIDLNHLT